MEREDSWRAGLDPGVLDGADWTSQVKDYAIIRLDPEGLVLSWNAGAELVKGYGREEILLAQAVRDGRVEHEGWRLRRDGARFWGDVVITAVHGPDGALLGFIKVTRDLTEQHRLEQGRELFLAGVTHDFRSPLTSIEGYAAMLAADLTDPVLGDFAARIRSNALRLMKLVDLMVEHCRMRAGRIGVSVAPVRLDAVLRTVVDDLSSSVTEHEVVVQPSDAVVVADATALGRVFTNVVGNAAKYSPPGSRIDVLVQDRGEDVEVVVADRGRGIDPADLERIFEEFERGRRAEDDGGFGLGLAVVRHLVELHGGTVQVGVGRFGGTDVTVRLPTTRLRDVPQQDAAGLEGRPG